MRKLNDIESACISGGSFFINDCYVTVPAWGVPAWDYQQIDNQYRRFFNSEITINQAVTSLENVPLSSLRTYVSNIPYSTRYCF